ncbi:hypothetical protein Ahy_B05g077659 isoform D [Arachis hypogaea]|uniref:RING-type domain-containing protein n=1 Tax=Arachis hypogaea TaxID=3818 RepID=A0A444Z5B0_ARAHY|nr:hypothetical protein Ahy_B05g077659 isoform D [Arachis hypogaea]
MLPAPSKTSPPLLSSQTQERERVCNDERGRAVTKRVAAVGGASLFAITEEGKEDLLPSRQSPSCFLVADEGAARTVAVARRGTHEREPSFYRFDKKGNRWKERTDGTVKFPKNKVTRKYSECADIAGTPPDGCTEIPTCPVCLERLDPDRSGILTTLCDHSFQCPCVSKWTYLSCRIFDDYNPLLTSQLETQRQSLLWMYELDYIMSSRYHLLYLVSSKSNLTVTVLGVKNRIGCTSYSHQVRQEFAGSCFLDGTGNYKDSVRGIPNYFLTYENGKSAACIQDHLRPNGAHRWDNYMKSPKCDRCGCKPTEDVKRCFMLEFDRSDNNTAMAALVSTIGAIKGTPVSLNGSGAVASSAPNSPAFFESSLKVTSRIQSSSKVSSGSFKIVAIDEDK